MKKENGFKGYGEIFSAFDLMTYDTNPGREKKQCLMDLCLEILKNEKPESKEPLAVFLKEDHWDNLEDSLFDLMRVSVALGFGLGFALAQRYEVTPPAALGEIDERGLRIYHWQNLITRKEQLALNYGCFQGVIAPSTRFQESHLCYFSPLSIVAHSRIRAYC
jgi:hypothetical protein